VKAFEGDAEGNVCRVVTEQGTIETKMVMVYVQRLHCPARQGSRLGSTGAPRPCATTLENMRLGRRPKESQLKLSKSAYKLGKGAVSLMFVRQKKLQPAL